MDQEPSTSKHWLTAIIASALVLVVAFGGVFSLRHRLMAEVTEDTRKAEAEREKLAGRISSLEASLASGSEGTDPEATQAKWAELSQKLETLTTRLDALEKANAEARESTPSPAPTEEKKPASASNLTFTLNILALSGKPFAAELSQWSKQHPDMLERIEAIKPFAAAGIPSEAEMIRELAAALGEGRATDSVEDQSTAGKINTHLKGLVSIKKTNQEDPYETLRREALTEDLSTLARHVQQLPENSRAPLEDWLKHVKDRAAALDAVASLTQDTSL